MQLKIQGGTVELSGKEILKNINFEVNDTSRIAVVGRNGCGKTTLLRLISGEYTLSASENGKEGYFTVSGSPVIGVLSQITFKDDSLTLLEEVRSAYSEILALKSELYDAQMKMENDQSQENIRNYTNLLDTFTNAGGFYFEKEYEAAIKHFGFTEEEKLRPLNEFSGGQRTKIALLKLILSKPDILLLDEPTNHLDIEAVEWLEGYLKEYKKAFVVVSHDRMFLDNTVNTVYEIEHGKITRYNGNYTQFTASKKQLREQQAKAYYAQKKEIERLKELAERFKAKPTKAAMAKSKLKQIEHMIPIEAPDSYDLRTFRADFEPEDIGVKDMLSVKNLRVGYDKVLSEINIEIKNGDHVGIIGGNGLGKSTFIRTLMGKVNAMGGEFKFAQRAKIGYFDQQMAQYSSANTVLYDFMSDFPAATENEARSALGAFMFSGEDVFKTVDMLSGGERVRLALCKIFKKRPNFLILDEPTNHMDILGKETLEDMLAQFSGTVMFVSHDRYFIKKAATEILEFSADGVTLYPYGYEQYLEKHNIERKPEFEIKSEKPKKEKKTYTTPAKERSKAEHAVKKAEQKISELESRMEEINAELSKEENISDYIKITELQSILQQLKEESDAVLIEWETASEKLELLSGDN